MRTILNAGLASLGALVVLAGGLKTPAYAEQTGPSDETVNAVIKYAWAMLPTQFTNKDGNVILVDKNKPESVNVPLDVVREIVRVGRVSAHAQVCNMPDDQTLNHRSMMKREVDKKTWTDQQKLWINQIHLTTVMLLTGKIKAVEKDGDDGKEVAVIETNKDSKQTNTCTPEQATAVKDKIKAYVDAGPKLVDPPAAAAPAAAPAATASTTPAAKPTAAAAPAPEKK